MGIRYASYEIFRDIMMGGIFGLFEVKVPVVFPDTEGFPPRRDGRYCISFCLDVDFSVRIYVSASMNVALYPPNCEVRREEWAVPCMNSNPSAQCQLRSNRRTWRFVEQILNGPETENPSAYSTVRPCVAKNPPCRKK